MNSTRCPALTVCQPYAELIASGQKPIENRTWFTSYRGPLLIHAGKSRAWLDDPADKDRFVFGAIVALATVRACLSKGGVRAAEMQAWAAHGVGHLYEHEHAHGDWCWILTNVTRLREPVPCAGAQGLWFPSNDRLSQVWAELP